MQFIIPVNWLQLLHFPPFSDLIFRNLLYAHKCVHKTGQVATNERVRETIQFRFNSFSQENSIYVILYSYTYTNIWQTCIYYVWCVCVCVRYEHLLCVRVYVCVLQCVVIYVLNFDALFYNIFKFNIVSFFPFIPSFTCLVSPSLSFYLACPFIDI